MFFLKVERKKILSVAEQAAEIEGIAEVYSVGGRFDLIAIIRVRNNDQLADIVTGHLFKVDGIVSSETMIAFRVHSRHDLERMFSIGM